ncbi:MAG: rhomboid family intramembrane serine protease [Thaumarchaeota archaeon]|nr:rhomboid family intramembrane serine protease [Nitrososphaerota archaeon]
MRLTLGRGQSMMQGRGPKWTYILIGLSVLGYILQHTVASQVGIGIQISGFNLERPLWFLFSFVPLLAFDMPWMFVTSIFLHADLSHLFFNMFSLLIFGIYLERMVGGRLFLILFFAAGIIGNVGYIVTSGNALVPAIGASGAIYGVMGTLAVLAPFLLIFVYGILPLPMIVAAGAFAVLDIMGLLVPSGIAHGAHLAGMIVGIGAGLYLRRMRYL